MCSRVLYLYCEENIEMKVGTLVNFFTTFEPFLREYTRRNPGLVLSTKKSDVSKCSATVLWSDGSLTTEHAGYLVESHNEER